MYFDELADVVERKSLQLIQDNYECETVRAKMTEKFTREFIAEKDDKQRAALIEQDARKIEVFMNALTKCTEVIAQDNEKDPFVARQLLEVRERMSQIALLKLYDLCESETPGLVRFLLFCMLVTEMRLAESCCVQMNQI